MIPEDLWELPKDLRAIYELLFRDGVLVAKKDKRPQSKHPEIQAVTNLQVMRAMGSLKSRGYVRETFAWRHFYWYLNNEGIIYPACYLRLPAEIVPSSLQRANSRVGAESQESVMDRQGYRRKRTADVNEEALAERTPRFRGPAQLQLISQGHHGSLGQRASQASGMVKCIQKK
ncbi:hypothetical protein SKAU_G00215560 [Synaphobranchus kaupii]|uniref:Plectin/eS10 N-terminal domain-containing protein n=1 Tax=Synaphobranchus kaupii TaxID=118154 RepID=A0A9Q1IV02_SYNKA|nr:hypothetical protein SKAU_G00215560 [Synaphobranchus kaupii]